MPAQLARVEAIFREACAGVQWKVLDYFASALTGGDGNPEYLRLGPRPWSKHECIDERQAADQLRVLPAEHAGRRREAEGRRADSSAR